MHISQRMFQNMIKISNYQIFCKPTVLPLLTCKSLSLLGKSSMVTEATGIVILQFFSNFGFTFVYIFHFLCATDWPSLMISIKSFALLCVAGVISPSHGLILPCWCLMTSCQCASLSCRWIFHGLWLWRRSFFYPLLPHGIMSAQRHVRAPLPTLLWLPHHWSTPRNNAF